MHCCICGKPIDVQYDLDGKMIWDKGHNALPVKDGRCCSECNINKVVPERLRQYEESQK